MGDNYLEQSRSPEEMFKIKWTIWDKILTPFYRVEGFIGDKWRSFRRRCQRFKRGYAWSDVWNMNTWFIDTIKPMLQYLLDNHYGYPCDTTNEDYEAGLEEMITCLKLMNEESARNYLGIKVDDYSVESSQKCFELMETNKKKFFKQFEKQFWSLWD